MSIFEQTNVFLWEKLIPILLIGIGVYLSVSSGFLQIRRFPKMFSVTIGRLLLRNEKQDGSGLTAWQSVSTALASTIGTGSIVGVAVAMKFGGPGALLWMWVSTLLGMIIKYAEIALSVQFRRKNQKQKLVGGPMYYLKYGLRSDILSVSFAIFCIGACFGMGNMVQANAISASLYHQFQVDPIFFGAILLVFVGFVIFGGCQRIAKTNAYLVPVMCSVYVSCCVVIIFSRVSSLPSVFRIIFREAFSLSAATGGISSYGIFAAIRNGFSKGVFASEAGLGSAPIAHGCGGSQNEVEHGLWGMLEVFFTALICTLTSLVILTSDVFETKQFSVEAMTQLCFEEALPNFGGVVVCISTLLFSLSSILGWAFYGEICIDFLFKQKKVYLFIFRICYVIAAFIGAVGSMQRIWIYSELMNALMMIPNLIGIVLLVRRVFCTSNRELCLKIKNNRRSIS